jgi:hypothetical protein
MLKFKHGEMIVGFGKLLSHHKDFLYDVLAITERQYYLKNLKEKTIIFHNIGYTEKRFKSYTEVENEHTELLL